MKERWIRWDWRNLSLPRLHVNAWDDCYVAVYFDVSYEGGDDAFSVGCSFQVPYATWCRIHDWEQRRLKAKRARDHKRWATDD